MESRANIACIIRWIARIALVIIALFWFVFALLSGAENYGGGMHGILANTPNAIPWLILFVFVYVAWKWELVGGWMIIAFGIFSAFFFNVAAEPTVLLMITIPLLILGSILLISRYMDARQKHNAPNT